MPRPPGAKTLVDRQLGRNLPHPTLPAGDTYVVPNHSGISDHPEMLGEKGFVKKSGDTMTGDLTTKNLTVGLGAAGVDYTLSFAGETNSTTLTWKEDEDYLLFADDSLITGAKKILFRDTAIFIGSLADGDLTIQADDQVKIVGNTEITGNLITSGDNTTADAHYTPNILFNTDATPPTASLHPIGSLYVQYTA